ARLTSSSLLYDELTGRARFAARLPRAYLDDALARSSSVGGLVMPTGVSYSGVAAASSMVATTGFSSGLAVKGYRCGDVDLDRPAMIPTRRPPPRVRR